MLIAARTPPHCIAQSYIKYWWLGNLCLALSAPFELFDFAPLFGTFDGHSLWHGGGVVVTHYWFLFGTAHVNALLAESGRKTFD